MIYDRYHTRQLDDLGGLAARLPLLACTMVFISMASIGLPGLNGFVGEMLSLAGMFRAQSGLRRARRDGRRARRLVPAHDAAARVLRPAARAARMASEPIRDMNVREMFAVAPICALVPVDRRDAAAAVEFDSAGCRCGRGGVRRIRAADGRQRVGDGTRLARAIESQLITAASLSSSDHQPSNPEL